MAEALSMEADLRLAKSHQEKEKIGNSTELIQKVYDVRPLTPEAVAQALRNERISADQAHSMVEQLCQELLSFDASLTASKRSTATEPSTKNGSASGDAIVSPTVQSQSPRSSSDGAHALSAASLLASRLECLIGAAEILDRSASEVVQNRWSGPVAPSLKSHRTQIFRAAEMTKAREAARQLGFQQTQQRVSASVDSSNNNHTISYTGRYDANIFPSWMPTRILNLFDNSTCGNLSSKDVNTIKQKVLTESRFVCTSSESTPSAAIFRGNIRSLPDRSVGNSLTEQSAGDSTSSDLYRDLTSGIEKEGLNQRVQLFLMNDPAEQIDTEHPTPVVLVLPAILTPEPRSSGLFKRVFEQISVIVTLWTLFGYAVSSYALNPKFFSFIVDRHDVHILSGCTPVFWGVLGIHFLHEVVHYLIARARGIQLGWPLPLPSVALGTFGCITKLKSFPANRKDMFDFSMGGPVAAAVSSLVFMIIGIQKTVHAPSQALGDFPFLPVSTFKSSFLVGTLLTFLAPKVMSLPLSQPIPIHPLFVIGFSGMISSALNLLPLFRLDGGRACDAAMGSRYSEFASATTMMFLVSNIISKGTAPLFSTWFMFIILLQRNHEVPSRDELTKICRLRFGSWVCALTLSILALLPFPGYRRPSLYNF
ncbi:hypothetical protein ACA910_020689 [Epithemia clementina (nom. ined.)]